MKPLSDFCTGILRGLVFLVVVHGAHAATIITTVAGNGTRGFSGDGAAATGAQFDGIYGVAADAAGNLYIADLLNNRIRKVDTGGLISTVAGNGTQGFSGDGGAAASAALSGPQGVAVDGTGNLYIADWGNNRIRKVDSGGVITTVAGNGTWGFSGDGGAAISAQLNGTAGVAVDDAGKLYIADWANNRIRRVDSGGGITTVAGNGTQGFSGDGGAATGAALNGPVGVAVDGAGNLYIADSNNHRIRKVDSGGVITTVAGNGTAGYSGDGGAATGAELNWPRGVAVDAAGTPYIADEVNNRIRQVDSGGIITTVAGDGTPGFSGDGGVATSAALWFPSGVAADAAGNLYIVDGGNNRIRRLSEGTATPSSGGGGSSSSGGGSGSSSSGGGAMSPFLLALLGLAAATRVVRPHREG